MSVYAIPPLLGTLAFASLGFFVFLHPPHTKEKKIFSFLCLQTFVWQIVWFISFFSSQPSSVDFLAKFAYIGITFIPFTFYHFIVEFLKEKNETIFVRLFYALAVALIAIIFPTDLFVSGHRHFSWGSFAAAGPLYPVFMVSALVTMLRGCYLLLNARRHPEKYQITRNHIHYLFLGLLAYFFCTIDFPQVFGFKVYPIGTLFFLLSFSIISYAITRHHLLDIEIVIKKTLVFAGLLTMAMFVLGFIFIVPQKLAGRFFSINPTASYLLSMMVVILLYEPTRRWLVRVTDRFLFQKKEDFRLILNRLTSDIITILDLKKIGDTILSSLEESLRLESGVILTKDAEGYRILNSFNTLLADKRYSEDDIFIQYLIKHKCLLNLEDVQIRDRIPTLVLSKLEELNAVICVPLFLRNEMIGILTLGRKKSDEEFTKHELEYFPMLAGQVAISLSNAKLSENLLEEREEKLKAQHEARRVHYAEMLAHEVKNAVQAIDLPARSYCDQIAPRLETIYERFLKDALPNGVAKQYLKVCHSIVEMGKGIQQRAKKIRVITKTAQHHLSSDEAIFEEIYIKMLWEDSIHESGVKDVIFEFKGPQDQDLYIYGNPVLIQRVFINLIRNAADAMAAQKDKKITLTCRYQEFDSHNVAYFEFRDNGLGIPKELHKKIFEKGVSTKPKPSGADPYASGSGFGLYMCKDYVELKHHGKIWAESEVGLGAKFIFWIPVGKSTP